MREGKRELLSGWTVRSGKAADEADPAADDGNRCGRDDEDGFHGQMVPGSYGRAECGTRLAQTELTNHDGMAGLSLGGRTVTIRDGSPLRR